MIIHVACTLLMNWKGVLSLVSCLLHMPLQEQLGAQHDCLSVWSYSEDALWFTIPGEFLQSNVDPLFGFEIDVPDIANNISY